MNGILSSYRLEEHCNRGTAVHHEMKGGKACSVYNLDPIIRQNLARDLVLSGCADLLSPSAKALSMLQHSGTLWN